MRYTGTRDGNETRRDSKGYEYETDSKTGLPKMTDDSAKIMREQANEITRETKGSTRGTRALDQSRSMGNPASFSKGGSVSSRADGCAQRGKTKGRMV